MNTIGTPIKESMNRFKRVPAAMLGMLVFASAMVGSANADPVIYEPFTQTGGDADLTRLASDPLERNDDPQHQHAHRRIQIIACHSRCSK